MKPKDFICKEVKKICIIDRGLLEWKTVRGRVYKSLSELQPDIPKDGIRNFISYNVLNKPRMKLRTTRFLSRKLKLNSGFLNDRSLQDLGNIINLELYGVQEDDIRLLSLA